MIANPFMVINDNNYIKTKIKTFKDSIITNFHDKKEPKEKISYKCLSITVLDSVIKTDNKYYPQTFLEECLNKQQKQKNYITEELKSDSDSNNESELESESDTDSNDDETKSDIVNYE